MTELPVKINDLVQISIPGEESASTYPSRIDDIVNDRLILSWPTSSGVIVPVRKGQPVNVFFIREGAAYSFEAVIGETQRDPIPRIAVQPAGQVQRIQRRAYFRVRAMLPVQLTGIVQSSKNGEEDKEGVVHIVTSTVDISGAGMAIHYSAPIPVDTMFEAKLTIENDQPPLHLLARIVHSQLVVGVSNERPMYHIAFFFVAITEAQRRKIVRLCFRIQQQSLAHWSVVVRQNWGRSFCDKLRYLFRLA